ncbi:MAG TPA: hypothetical protein VM223_28530, partial [Planctomycetota bacterium]|nr:hypothetical protein [Planctomycetota bacterium]
GRILSANDLVRQPFPDRWQSIELRPLVGNFRGRRSRWIAAAGVLAAAILAAPIVATYLPVTVLPPVTETINEIPGTVHGDEYKQVKKPERAEALKKKEQVESSREKAAKADAERLAPDLCNGAGKSASAAQAFFDAGEYLKAKNAWQKASEDFDKAEVQARQEAALMSLGEMGYHAGMEAQIADPVHFEAAKQALQTEFGKTLLAQKAVFVPRAGNTGQVAWLFPDGRIVAAAKTDLSGEEHFSALVDALRHVADTVAKVSAIPADKLSSSLGLKGRYYTDQADQYQWIGVEYRSSRFEWVLDWPNASAGWTRVESDESGNSLQLRLDNVGVGNLKSTRKPFRAALGDVQFGRHTMSRDCLFYSHGYIVIGAFFPKPAGRISLSDPAGKMKELRKGFSEEIGKLRLPPPDQTQQ